MINAVANQAPCHLQIASLADYPFGPSRTQVRNAEPAAARYTNDRPRAK